MGRREVRSIARHLRARCRGLHAPEAIALALVVIAAWFGALQVGPVVGLQKAVWMSVVVSFPGEPTIMAWPNGEPSWSQTAMLEWANGMIYVGVRPPSSDALGILRVVVDGRPVPTKEVRIPSTWRALEATRQIEVSGQGLLGVPIPTRSLELQFEPGPGLREWEITWLDETQYVDLSSPSPGGLTVNLAAPTTRRAWLLLPARTIRSLILGVETGDAPLRIDGVTIHDSRAQEWQGHELASSDADSEDCLGKEKEGGAASILVVKGSCRFDLPELQALNPSAALGTTLLWLALAGIGTFTACVLRRCDDPGDPAVPGETGGSLTRRSGRSVYLIMLVVALAAIALHLAAAIFTPIRVTPDSVTYYNMAIALYRAKSLSAIDLAHTPGYPLFIASTIWLFGHQVQAIILLQQLAIALLAPLTVWFLYPRTNGLVSFVGGMVIAISPIATIYASHVWTEPVFLALGYAGMVAYLQRPPTARSAVLAGVLCAAATMVRPNGIMIVAALATWSVAKWWIGGPRTPGAYRSLTPPLLLVFVSIAACTPWILSYRERSGRWGLVNLVDDMTRGNALIEGRMPADLAINAPYRTLYSHLASTAYAGRDPWVAQAAATDMGLAFPAVYYLEAARESIRTLPARYVEDVKNSLLFNAFAVPPPGGGSLLSYPEVFTYTYVTRSEEYPAPYPGFAELDDGKAFLRMMAYRWEPPQSRARSAILSIERVGYAGWGFAIALALLGLTIHTMVTRDTDALPLALFAFGLIAAVSLLPMPIDRYVMTVEPYLYTMIMLGAHSSILAVRRVALKRHA